MDVGGVVGTAVDAAAGLERRMTFVTMTALIVPASTASAMVPSAMSTHRRLMALKPWSGSTGTDGLGLVTVRDRSLTGSAAGRIGPRSSRVSRGVDVVDDVEDGVVRAVSKNVIGSGLTEDSAAGGS
jgi:hypothetical protein